MNLCKRIVDANGAESFLVVGPHEEVESVVTAKQVDLLDASRSTS